MSLNGVRRRLAQWIYPEGAGTLQPEVPSPRTMDSQLLLHLARIYARRNGWTLSTVSTYMGGSGDTLARLEKGHGLTLKRTNTFVRYFSDNWPADLPWPSDIPRPRPN